MYHFQQQSIIRGLPWFCRKDSENKPHKSCLFSPLTQCLALYPQLYVQLWRGGRWQRPACSPASCGRGHYLSCKMLLHVAAFSHLLRERAPFSSHWQGNEKRPQIHCTDTWHLGACFVHLIWDFKPVPIVHCNSLKSAVKTRASIQNSIQNFTQWPQVLLKLALMSVKLLITEIHHHTAIKSKIAEALVLSSEMSDKQRASVCVYTFSW